MLKVMVPPKEVDEEVIEEYGKRISLNEIRRTSFEAWVLEAIGDAGDASVVIYVPSVTLKDLGIK